MKMKRYYYEILGGTFEGYCYAKNKRGARNYCKILLIQFNLWHKVHPKDIKIIKLKKGQKYLV